MAARRSSICLARGLLTRAVYTHSNTHRRLLSSLSTRVFCSQETPKSPFHFPHSNNTPFSLTNIHLPHKFSFNVSSCSYSTNASSSSSQINHSEFTEMAWEGIVGAVDAARISKQQVVESEHLMKALLEQKDGLARRILTKAGIDNTSVLQATDDFISKQPKVIGETSGPVVGSDLSVLLSNARNHKKDMKDDFVSVEHLLLAFLSDKRFGQLLFRNLQLAEKTLKVAVKEVRGNQREDSCKHKHRQGPNMDSPMLSSAQQYLKLRFLGAPVVLLSLAMQGVFRGFKDTQTPLYATCVHKWET